MYRGEYIDMGKKKLTLSIDEKLIQSIKIQAIKHNTTVSEMLEDYIRAINKKSQVIELIKNVK